MGSHRIKCESYLSGFTSIDCECGWTGGSFGPNNAQWAYEYHVETMTEVAKLLGVTEA